MEYNNEMQWLKVSNKRSQFAIAIRFWAQKSVRNVRNISKSLIKLGISEYYNLKIWQTDW